MIIYIQKNIIVYIIINHLIKNNYNVINYQNTNKYIYLNKFNIFFLKKNNLFKFTLYKNYQLFNTHYLKNIYKIAIKEKNINAINILPKNLSKKILFKTRKINYKNFNIKYFNEVIYLFLVNVWLKNSKNICKYIKKKLENVHFKKHKSYFLFFFKIISKYITSNFNLLKLKGLTLTFRGKLSKGGNSRKKVMSLKKGYFSLSNKLLILNTNKWDVWTKTGTFGCTMQLFYKNMTLFLNFYILIYIFTLIQIQFILNMHHISSKNITIPYLIYYINKFSKIKFIFFLLIISLSGIPPFLLFYVKFNFIINLLYKFNFLNTILIYLSLFLNMLFYIQFFFFKNINYSLNLKKKQIYLINYNNLYYSLFYLFLILSSFIFFSDFYFIIKLLFIIN